MILGKGGSAPARRELGKIRKRRAHRPERTVLIN
jgi:hypothetical protein